MGFRENLKERLEYNDMAVKELAALAGVHKRAIDNYLRSASAAMPAADAAVKIARALGVTVEYLVTGQENAAAVAVFTPETRKIIRSLHKVSARDRRLIAGLLDTMIERKE